MNNIKYYHWSGISNEGKRITGNIYAANPNLAKLQLPNLTSLSVRRTFCRHKNISTHDFVSFYRQLSTLLKAGVSLLQALHILTHHIKHPRLVYLISTIKHALEAGNTFSSALKQHPHYFDTLTCQLIYIAEETGTLDAMLTRLAHHKEKMLALKNKIIQASIYPCMVMSTAIFVSLILLLFVIPRFTTLFTECHIALPTFTLWVIQFSTWLRRYYGLSLLPAALAYLLYKSYQKYPSVKIVIDSLLIQLPILGELLKKFAFASFSKTLSTILFAGIPLAEGLKMLSSISRNNLISAAIRLLHQRIVAGDSLYYAMQQQTFFPVFIVQMTRVGEESGTLDNMLEKLADFYESEIDLWIKKVSNLLEPLIIMILGVLIGGLVIAMYLPIFKLGTVM